MLPESIAVEVFKTARSPDTYLFVPEGTSPGEWPDGLEQIFLPAEKVLSMTLTADRFLAMQPAARVMEEIVAKGYFLQLPPQSPARDEEAEAAPC